LLLSLRRAKKEPNELSEIMLVSIGCSNYVCSNFARSIASMLVFLKACEPAKPTLVAFLVRFACCSLRSVARMLVFLKACEPAKPTLVAFLVRFACCSLRSVARMLVFLKACEPAKPTLVAFLVRFACCSLRSVARMLVFLKARSLASLTHLRLAKVDNKSSTLHPASFTPGMLIARYTSSSASADSPPP